MTDSNVFMKFKQCLSRVDATWIKRNRVMNTFNLVESVASSKLQSCGLRQCSKKGSIPASASAVPSFPEVLTLPGTFLFFEFLLPMR